MATTWNPPLPQGFEARWDPNQRAYFYINHSTKTTTWQDPRFTQQPAAGYQATGGYQARGGYQASGGYQAAGGNQATGHQAAAQTLNPQGYGGHSGGNVGHKMTTINKQFGSTISRSQGSDAETDDDGEESEDFDELFKLAGSSEGKVDVQKLHQIKQTFPSAPEDVIKELLLRKHNAVVQVNNALFEMGYKREVAGSHPPPRQVDMAERIRAMFPSVPPTLVDDILTTCHNDEKKARQQLEAIGYKPTFPATHKDATRPKSSSRSPARHPSPKPRAEKPKPSPSEIRRMENKLVSEFKLVDREMMQTALQICDYDEQKTRVMLEGMMDEATSNAKKDTSRTVSRSRSPSPSFVGVSTLLEPQSIADDGYNEGPSMSMDHDIPSFSASNEPFDTYTERPSSSRGSTPLKKGSDAVSRPSTSKSSRPVSPKKSPSPKPPPSPKKKTSPPKQKSHQQRAKQVTQMSKDVLSSTIQMLNQITNGNCCGTPELPAGEDNEATSQKHSNQSDQSLQSHDADATNENSKRSPTPVVAQQPRPSDHTSEYRTQSKGPDPSLPQGPNKQLLLSEYSQAKGHNPELRVGPDRSRVQGPQGASGPNHSLPCGASFQKDTRSPHLIVTSV